MTILHQVLVHLRAGRWIEAHNLVQSDASPRGAWLHGILHIQEGDLEDAEYWYSKADRHFRSRGSLDQELKAFEGEMHLSIRRVTAGERDAGSETGADSG
jgi:hypothetical protein